MQFNLDTEVMIMTRVKRDKLVLSSASSKPFKDQARRTLSAERMSASVMGKASVMVLLVLVKA